MVAESSEFDLTLSRAHRVHFFQLEIPIKKRDILSEKRVSGMVLTKREFAPDNYTSQVHLRTAVTIRGHLSFLLPPHLFALHLRYSPDSVVSIIYFRILIGGLSASCMPVTYQS